MAVQHLMTQVAQVRDGFHAAVFSAGDVEVALALAAADVELAVLPAGTGATDAAGLRRFLVEDLVPHRPADLSFRRVSRTGDRWRVAQEDVVTFTHDRELPWLLPGVPATHRAAEVLAVSVVTVRHGRVTSHRTLWDQASLAAQLRIAAPPTAQPPAAVAGAATASSSVTV